MKRLCQGVVMLIILTCVCELSAQSMWSQRVYHPVPSALRDSSIFVSHQSENTSHRLVVEARGALTTVKERAGMASSYWGYRLVDGDNTVTISFRNGNTDFGDILDERYTQIEVVVNESSILKEDYTKGFATSSGAYNTFQLDIDRTNSVIKVMGGDRFIHPMMEIPYETGNIDCMSMEIWSVGELRLSNLSTESWTAPETKLATEWTMDGLKGYFAKSSDSIEGFWKYLDRQNDPRYAKLGGRYVIALVKDDNEPGAYDIIYIDGAETMGQCWYSGMRKGRLRPTIFQSHYDLCWYDSTFESHTEDVHASITDNSILTLSFPMLKTTLRFSKAPNDKE